MKPAYLRTKTVRPKRYARAKRIINKILEIGLNPALLAEEWFKHRMCGCGRTTASDIRKLYPYREPTPAERSQIDEVWREYAERTRQEWQARRGEAA